MLLLPIWATRWPVDTLDFRVDGYDIRSHLYVSVIVSNSTKYEEILYIRDHFAKEVNTGKTNNI